MDPVRWLVPGPVHAVVAVAWLAWWSWKPRSAATPVSLRVVLMLWLAAAWAGATPALGHLLASELEQRHPVVPMAQIAEDPHAVIVVLASGSMFRPDGSLDVELSDDGLRRTRTGIALWRHTGGRLLFVGGPGHGAEDSLAGHMAREAARSGVPAEVVQTVGGTRSTREDLVAVAGQRTGKAGEGGEVWLVTSAMHMPRAMASARELGLRAKAFPAPARHGSRLSPWAWLPQQGDPQLWRSALHEWLGLAYYAARGWVSTGAGQPISP